jgi:hypothetical protein
MITTDKLVEWIDYLAECDAGGAHWCPDLAGLIASAPAGVLETNTDRYGTEGEYDPETDTHEQMREHAWTVDSIVRWAVLQIVALDVCEKRLVCRELGELLVDLSTCDQLSPETADELAAALAELWDILVSPNVLETAFDDTSESEIAALQSEALASIGVAA